MTPTAIFSIDRPGSLPPTGMGVFPVYTVEQGREYDWKNSCIVGNFPQGEEKHLPVHENFSTSASVVQAGISLPFLFQCSQTIFLQIFMFYQIIPLSVGRRLQGLVMLGLARVYAVDKHLGRACPYTRLSLHPRVIPGIEQPRERDRYGCCHSKF